MSATAALRQRGAVTARPSATANKMQSCGAQPQRCTSSASTPARRNSAMKADDRAAQRDAPSGRRILGGAQRRPAQQQTEGVADGECISIAGAQRQPGAQEGAKSQNVQQRRQHNPEAPNIERGYSHLAFWEAAEPQRHFNSCHPCKPWGRCRYSAICAAEISPTFVPSWYATQLMSMRSSLR